VAAVSARRTAELLAILPQDRGRGLQPNADGAALVDEGAPSAAIRLTTSSAVKSKSVAFHCPRT